MAQGMSHGGPGDVAMGLAARAAFALLPAAGLAAVVALLASGAGELALRLPWVPAIGVEWAFRLDGLAVLMLLMIFGVGTAVFVYAGGYLAGHPGQRRLFGLLTMFMLAMAGCVAADHVVPLFLFWELTSVTSFLLVGFDHERLKARKSAQQALLVTGMGGLALLAGFLLLWQAMGTGVISDIVARLPHMPATPTLVLALLLIVVGAFTKSAQFPFHFWLPNAMAAPTPVSAYLHSATMVKLGVYLLARLDAGFGDWLLWQWLLQGAGSITAAWGMLLALRERDLKRILAWSTVATLGTLVALVGLRGESAAVAVGALLLAHALYKAPLFFVAGNIDHGAGTRIIDHLGHLRSAMPWTAAAALLAGMSMAGIPLSFGHVVKDAIIAAKDTEDALLLARAANTVFSAVAVAVAGVAAIRVFWRAPRGRPPRHVHEGGPALVLPPILLALAGIVLGLFPVLAQPLVVGASQSLLPADTAPAVRFAWLSVPALASFALTFALGAALFIGWDALHRHIARLVGALQRFGVAATYERSLKWIPQVAAGSARVLQHGRLPGYLAQVVGFIALAMGLLLALLQPSLPPFAGPWPGPGVLGACLLVATGAVLALFMRERLRLLLAAGLVGYGSAVLFLFSGAPDLAFTQFIVETVFVVVVAAVLLALRRLGRAWSLPEPGWRPGALLLSLGFGSVVTALMLVAATGPFDEALPVFFGEQSVPAAQGRNVVNVILVDFRALDTLGEIAVVMLSLLAAVPLLRALRPRPPAMTPDASLELAGERDEATRPVILRVVAGPLYGVILAVSAWVLLRGHNEPGGGFIAGLVAVSATVLWGIAYGSAAATARLPLRAPLRLAAAGVGLALLAGLAALLTGQAFLTHLWATLPLGAEGVKVSTVMLFDLGVYACVWGSLAGYALALLDVDALAEESP